MAEKKSGVVDNGQCANDRIATAGDAGSYSGAVADVFVIGYCGSEYPVWFLKPDDARLKLCTVLQNFKEINDSSVVTGIWPLPVTISAVAMDYISKWCTYHVVEDEKSFDTDTKLTQPEIIMHEFMPDTKIPHWDEVLFGGMDMRTRLTVMNAARQLGCDEMTTNLGKFIAKKMVRKTPEAMRQMLGVVNSGLTEEEQNNWEAKYSWARVSCTDDVDEPDIVRNEFV